MIAITIILGVLFVISTGMMYHAVGQLIRLELKYEQLAKAHAELKVSADELVALVEHGVVAHSREQILKRAMQDLATADISRAAFVIDVLYGQDGDTETNG